MSYNLKNAKLFPWWCNKVLPLVYDDSLSYYEVLCKIMETLKDLIEVEELQNNAITDLDKRTTSVEGRMDTAESDIDALEGRMDTAENDIDNLETRMTTAEGDIDSLEGRMTTAEGDIDAVEGRMTTAEGDIDSLETRMTTAEGDIDAVEGRMTTAEGDIDSLETRMTTAEGDIDTLEGNMGTAQDDIRTLRWDYTTLNGNVESLEAKTYSHGFGIGNNDTNIGRTALTRALFYNGQMIDGMSEDTSIGRYHDYANNTDVDGEFWETDYIPLCNKNIDEIGRTFYVMNPMGVDNKPVMIYCFANNDVGGMGAYYEYKSAISPSDLTEYETDHANYKQWKFTVPSNSNAIKIVFNTTYIPSSQISGSDYNVGTNVGFLSHSKDNFSHFTSAPYMLQNFQTAYCDILKYPIFNCTETYNAGDIVRKGWKLYRAKVNVPATSYFDSSPITGAWELITVKEIIDDIKRAKNQITTINSMFETALSHNTIFRGANLTGKYTVAQFYAKVHAGDFSDLYLGDFISVPLSTNIYQKFTGSAFAEGTTYYERSGTHPSWTYAATTDTEYDSSKTYYTKSVVTESVAMMIAHFDYYYNCGDSSPVTYHHVILIPRTRLKTTSYMNPSNTTDGAYYNSEMHQTILPCYAASFSTALENHVRTWRDMLSTEMTAATPSMAVGGLNGSATAWDWKDTNIRLMNEAQVYGTGIWSSSAYDYGCENRQLAVFRFISPVQYERDSYWLSSVVNSTLFAGVKSTGNADYYSAGGSLYVRPLIVFG